MVAQTSINYPPVDQTGLSSKDRGRGPHIMQEQCLTQRGEDVKMDKMDEFSELMKDERVVNYMGMWWESNPRNGGC